MSVRFEGFRPEFLDFKKGIRVGHLEPHQRITQLLKLSLESLYEENFVIDRWGRGVYWQWICFLPKANRTAKPISADVNFGCSKFFIKMDRTEVLFKAGLHIERGRIESSGQHSRYQLQEDWDWHRLVQAIHGRSTLYRLLRRLVQEDGFRIYCGTRESGTRFDDRHFPSAAALKKILRGYPDPEWVVFQLYYPMTPEEVHGSIGSDLVESILAIMQEVAPVMNECMQIHLAIQEQAVS
ncbi:MAG: hypothetical protein V3R94_09785 [Acidobacteriota bacterium]